MSSHRLVTAPPRPLLALPPRPAQRRGLWALPLLISLIFVSTVLGWLRANEQSDIEDQRSELISDALSLQAQVGARIEREASALAEFARTLDAQHLSPAAFASTPEVQRGLHRFWISLTWLDAGNRMVAHVPEQAPRPELHGSSSSGLSAHLSVPLGSGGALIARYSPTDMLRQNVPWWLARKYDVRLVDSYGDVIATTTERRDPGDHQFHRIRMAAPLDDAWLELIARDRIPHWYQGVPVAMVAGFVMLIVAISWLLRRQVLDVSRAEAAWRTEAAWRGAMEDSLTVGLRARDLDGRILYVNRAFADMVGYGPEELNGQRPPMPYWPSDAIDESMQRHLRNMAGDAPRGGYEARWRHRDGRAVDVIMFEAPLVDAGGDHIGWMGSVIDITERKRLEDLERRQTDTMAHHARLTMLGEIASTLAHELNQPLSAISSYNAGVMNSLQRAAPDASPVDPAVLRALQRLGEQAAHAGRIVQRIREFLTRREPQLEPCELNGIVTGAIELLKRELSRRQVQLTLVLESVMPSITADAVLIEQVVINLVRNAGDALAQHPSSTERPRSIEVRTTRTLDPRFVRLDVRDNGPGINGQGIEALAAPFYSTRPDGMGMGLAICRSIVEAHHGALDAADMPGGGASFSLTLPVQLPIRLNATGAAAHVEVTA